MGDGKKSKSVIVGWRYFMGVQLALCQGPVDKIRRIIVGEREAWSGSITGNTTFRINKPDLFGGDDREGGVVGYVDVLMGASDQPRNAYLAKHQGATCPAYRGLATLVFKSFMWSSGNPYFKSPWVELTRVLKGWADDPWFPEAAYIGELDMNPAHIVYQCFTESWGMGYSRSEMGESFRTCATKLKDEGFGLSLEWVTQDSIENFVKDILSHCNGAVGFDMTTGKFEMKLIRDDYTLASLRELNETNIINIKSFQRASFGDAANEVVVSYTDRDQNTVTLAVQDIASITAQGAVISTTRAYPGIRTAELAARVGMRDLKVLSSPLAQITMTTNRVMWDKERGDVVKIVWPKLGINGVAFRIVDINKGTLTQGEIEVKLVEDVFGLPSNGYSSGLPTQWIDTLVPPTVAGTSRAIEATYWDVIHNISLADQKQLEEGYGFGTMFVGRGAVQSTLGYTLSASADDVEYTDVGSGDFNPTGTLVSTISQVDEVVTLSGAYDLHNVVLSEDGGYAIIENEVVSVISCDSDSGVVEIRRGILDTVPARHTVGSRMFFMVGPTGTDSTERTNGEVVYYKPRPKTGIGTLPVDDADAVQLSFTNRASRPYPPGNLKVDGSTFPVTIPGPAVTVSWAHRDRLAQTVEFVDYKTGNIGPEPGTTYRLRLYSGVTLLHEYEIDGTEWSYPSDHDTADGHIAVMRIRVNSVCNGLESLYAAEHTFQRSVVAGNIGVDTPPTAPILLATDGHFQVDLTWVWGDGRTNIEKVELRVADVPDYTKSTVLQYVDYPEQQYTHELGTVKSFRWYWARATDVNGLISEWSNMVAGRAVSFSPTDMLNSINELLTDGSGTAKIEMISDRFSIVAPDGSKTPFAVVEKTPGNWATLLNSEVLIGGNVDIANLNSGALPNDVTMRLGGGVIELDGGGEIRVFKDLSPNADFVRLSSGEIRFLRYINGVYQTYNYLSRLETGIAANGVELTIPGYWKAQPRIMVSPAVLSLYKKDYVNQDQAISCTAQNIVEVVPGGGVWKFTPTATLNLAAASGGFALNIGTGDISANTFTTGTQVTPANCTKITPFVSLKSNRGNGTSQYYRRNVKWRVEYYSGGSWVNGEWYTIPMGDQLNAVTDSKEFTFPSAGTWQWRIGYEAVDKDGTVFGAMQYSYSQTTASGTLTAQQATVTTPDKTLTLPLSSPSITGEIYQISYSWSCSTDGSLSSTGQSVWGKFYNFGVGSYGASHDIAYSYTYDGQTTHRTPADSWSGAPVVTGSNLSFTNSLTGRLVREGGTPVYNPALSAYNISGSATIYMRNPIPNSTTPTNNFLLQSYNYTLTTAQVLATGSVNWMAVGE